MHLLAAAKNAVAERSSPLPSFFEDAQARFFAYRHAYLHDPIHRAAAAAKRFATFHRTHGLVGLICVDRFTVEVCLHTRHNTYVHIINVNHSVAQSVQRQRQ
jgi:hypothetical protein